ncbi:uncharacterized protein LOC130928377 isoform X2 [Corythoichthys intestinalis]|nr:uncharacterized protein LOC130928377 isoform X2 [Corythoichthys intestinalis]
MAGNQDFSEAAKAEWLAAKEDELRAAGDRDTDMMVWWSKVEQWDENTSKKESKHHDKSESFSTLVNNVDCGLRVYNQIFTARAEALRQHVVKLHQLAQHLKIFHKKAKNVNSSGGTTAAVGGAAVIAGILFAPCTLGLSLLGTVVGLGVAAAGGITSASASISDNVNNIQERKKAEAVLQQYEIDSRELAKILHFIHHDLEKLRGHPFLKSGKQPYSESQEVGKAVKMISLAYSLVTRAMKIMDGNLDRVHKLQVGTAKYFKGTRNKKASKTKLVVHISGAANTLSNVLQELNDIWKELQVAIGQF